MKQATAFRLEKDRLTELKEIAAYIGLSEAATVEAMIKTVHGSMDQIELLKLPVTINDLVIYKTKNE